MICKKGAKERNKKKVNSVNVEDSKQLITRRTSRLIALSSISGAKQTRIDSKNVGSKPNKSSLNNRIKDKKSEKTSQTIESKVKRCAKKERKNSYNNKSNKSKIKTIKEIAKKVKTKTCNKVEEVVKRKLRNNCKIDFELEETQMKSIDNLSKKSKTSKQSSDNMVWNYDQKLSLKNVCHNSSKPNSGSNLCTKLFPTLNCVKPLNSSKSCNNLEKQKNSDLKSKSNLRTNLKIESKNNTKQKESEKTINNKKSKPKTKTKNMRKSVNSIKKCNSSSKPKNKRVNNRTEKVKQNNCINNNKLTKPQNKSNKSDKSSDKEKANKVSVGRGHRLASLNAIAKVRLLCENEKNDFEERSDDSSSTTISENERVDRKGWTKAKDKSDRKGRNECKALVVVDKSRKQVAVRKRKTIDDSIEIIDTRSCKRMASLNASAIMAASYLPERVKRSKSVESNHSNSSVEMVREMQTISQTVSRFEISPSVNGLHVNHMNHMNEVSHQTNGVILAEQKHQTIETVKQMKVSNKIKDRLLGIAKLERNQRARQRRKETKNQRISDDNQSLSGAEMSAFQATKVQVTKVTHINTSQDKKSGHKIDSILERDSSVVHKYQVQTKSTIEMQTTFNSSNGSTIGNVTTMTAPQQTATTLSGPQVQIHIAGTPAQVVSAPILPAANSGQPTYFNFPGAAPVVQLHNQYQAMASGAPNLNPMSIINLSEPYPTHYSSAFSVPHFATHSHPTPTPFNYFHPGLYQPAGPLLQPFHDPCLIHKPIPFHPSTPQVSHVHNSSQFQNPTLQTHSSQTFPNEMTQPFLPNTQFFHQFPNPIRPSQAVFFQAMPQTSSSMAPNGTTFAFLNSGVHYTHPTVVHSEQLGPNATPIVNENMSYVSPSTKLNASNNTNPSVAPNPSTDNCRQHISKSIQCSPQSRDQFETTSENQFCDSTNSSVRMSHNVNKASVVTVGPQMTKKVNKSDNKSEKRKKSMLLKPNQNQKIEELVVRNNASHTQMARHEAPVSSVKSLKNALTPSNKTNSINKSSSQHKNTKSVCFQINATLPSVSEPSEPSTPTPSPRLMPSRKQIKKRNSHGWSWEGIPVDKYVYLNNEEQSYLRKCYPAIRHNEGDVIRVRDCVLLRSGPRKTDLPFVAKICALWESPEGEMMMSLLWYYRPEHTDLEYYSTQLLGEIFASKHRDTNSVACIDDKCYVLTYNEFCRYKRSKLVKQSSLSTSISSTTVPALDEPYPRVDRLPPSRVFPELVFCCRKVYDYRQKRILKNPI